MYSVLHIAINYKIQAYIHWWKCELFYLHVECDKFRAWDFFELNCYYGSIYIKTENLKTATEI